MKALTLWQPWASAIAGGLKRIETRGWATRVRGPIAIHAAAKRDHVVMAAADALFGEMRRQFPAALRDAEMGFDRLGDMPFGAIVATAMLVDCVPSHELIETGRLSALEALWGNYDGGRYGFVLADIVRIEPIAAKGGQGWWEWSGSVPPAEVAPVAIAPVVAPVQVDFFGGA